MQTSVNGEKEPHGYNGHMYAIQCPEAYINSVKNSKEVPTHKTHRNALMI